MKEKKERLTKEMIEEIKIEEDIARNEEWHKPKEEYETDIKETDLRDMARSFSNQIRAAKLTLETMEPALKLVLLRLKKYD